MYGFSLFTTKIYILCKYLSHNSGDYIIKYKQKFVLKIQTIIINFTCIIYVFIVVVKIIFDKCVNL